MSEEGQTGQVSSDLIRRVEARERSWGIRLKQEVHACATDKTLSTWEARVRAKKQVMGCLAYQLGCMGSHPQPSLAEIHGWTPHSDA